MVTATFVLPAQLKMFLRFRMSPTMIQSRSDRCRRSWWVGDIQILDRKFRYGALIVATFDIVSHHSHRRSFLLARRYASTALSLGLVSEGYQNDKQICSISSAQHAMTSETRPKAFPSPAHEIATPCYGVSSCAHGSW